MDTIVIGIAGGTCSGKTTLTKRLKQHFGDDVSVVYHDSYYKRNDHMPYEERCLLNYDHPTAYDTDLFVEHLKALKMGQTIMCPTYDYTAHNRSDVEVEIKPAAVIIVEGILIFENPALHELMDIKIFVDTDADVRILRRIRRDVRDRGRSIDSVINQYLNTVKPMHEQYVERSKRAADIIILEGGHNIVALDMIIERTKSHIKSQQEKI